VSVDRTRLPTLGPDPRVRFPPISKSTLPNGLRVWSVEHRDLPILCFVVLFPVGSAADPRSRHGLASLAADLLDEGTNELTSHELHDALARIGAQIELEVGADATTVGLLTLTRFAQRGARLLADLVTRPRFDPVDFDRVRDIRVSRLQQLKDVPGAVADRLLAYRLYGDAPYGHTPFGTEGALRATTVEDVRAFHTGVALASRPTLIVVGDASHEEIVRLVSDAWPASLSGPRFAADDGADRAEGGRSPVGAAAQSENTSRIAMVDRPGAAQSELRLGKIGAARSTPDYPALAVLNTALGGAFVSRINLKLREEKGLTYGARSAFDFRREPGPFVVQASVQSDATAEAIGDTLWEIEGFAGDRPITPQELERAHAALTRGYPRSFETADQIAHAVAQLVLHGLSDDYFDRYVDRIRTVTEADVGDVARRYLDSDQMQAVVVADWERVGRSISTLGLGEPAIFPPAFEPGV
jgi:zinc protease